MFATTAAAASMPVADRHKFGVEKRMREIAMGLIFPPTDLRQPSILPSFLTNYHLSESITLRAAKSFSGEGRYERHQSRIGHGRWPMH